jgi:membrane glycosyltransferase
MTANILAAERWLYTGLVASTTALASVKFWNVLRVDGLTPLKWLVLALFASLFAWIAASFWLAALGFALRCLRQRESENRHPSAAGRISTRPSRTAIVLPIHNEDAIEVFARVQAMRESLESAQVAHVEFYVLSDSTEFQCWLAEEIEWDRLRRIRDTLPIYYRHRINNHAKKSGNIRDFCENWGALYDYMIVLDADSLVTGSTVTEMIRRMDENPRAALIQAPTALVGRQSLFARIQQFASSIYGPLFWEGLARLQGPDGNYWGHNAIIRIEPFMQNCGLPKLKGNGSLGGEILSHDFVEAALLRRAGWEVYMAPELGGSYEEPPPSLLHHVRRDRRWCQGNLQHIKLIFARGFKTPSRLHLAMGVMSYLSAPIWLCMIIAAVFETHAEGEFVPVRFEGKYPVLGVPNAHPMELLLLALMAAVLLFGPKILALVAITREKDLLKAHGGFGNVAHSIFWESIFSMLLAPVIMLSHAIYVAAIFLGSKARWAAQQRGDGGLSQAAVMRTFAPHTVAGLGAAALAWRYIPDSSLWLVPLLAGLALAVPLVLFTASPALGRGTRRIGLFLIPAETQGLAILERVQTAIASRKRTIFCASTSLLTRVVHEDPYVNALHTALLRDVTG